MRVRWWMDLGLAVASITMTIFYIILYYIWKELNAGISPIVPAIIWVSAIVRIILCLLPQNNWFGDGNQRLSILRNGIFAVTGFIDAVLFGLMGEGFGFTMACCIVLSFLFYLPVTLYAKAHPRVGILMLPKTVAYMIMIGLGLSMLPG